MLSVKAEKVVDGMGNLCYEVRTIKGQGLETLPDLYLEDARKVVVGTWYGRTRATYGGEELLREGGVYEEEEFQAACAKMQEAALLLHEINKKLASLREVWKGEETIEM